MSARVPLWGGGRASRARWAAAACRPPTTTPNTHKPLLEERCQARLHWGKAGWPAHARCFDGAVEYGSDWCQFGCAVRELDPAGKFKSVWDGWQWGATRGGAAVPFASCCTAAGFSAGCQCAPRAPCAPS